MMRESRLKLQAGSLQACLPHQFSSVGYSVTSDPGRLDGLKLRTTEWRVEPLDVSNVQSSYFSNENKFPKGSVEFDHALIMRNIEHEWHSEEDLYL